MYFQRRTEKYRTQNEDSVETQVVGPNATVNIDKGRRGPFLAPLSNKPTMIRKLFRFGISCWIAGGVCIGLAVAFIASFSYFGSNSVIPPLGGGVFGVMAAALGLIGFYPLAIGLFLVVVNWAIELYRSHLQPPMP